MLFRSYEGCYSASTYEALVKNLTVNLKVVVLQLKEIKGDKYYWQLVSNAILSNSKYAELIVYCPYASEIQSIKSNAEGQPNYYFIWAANDEDLPYINNDGYYKNLNIIRFEVPETDKQLLTEKVNKATALFRKILKT